MKMCEIIEVKSRQEVHEQFCALLEKGDPEGALGVAQVLWALCPDRRTFQSALGSLFDILTASTVGSTQFLRAGLLEIGFEHSQEFLLLQPI
jgi:hypothetical protein